MAFAQNLSRLIVPVAIGATLVQSSIYDVPGGYRAVLFDRFSGVQQTAKGEGTHFLIPWLQRAILYDVRIKPRNISTTTGSKDMQMVSLTLRVMSRPDMTHLPKIYQSLGQDYDERVLPSIGNEVLKATVAQFDASELITNREIVSARIRDDLLNRAKEFNIMLEDVSIFDPPPPPPPPPPPSPVVPPAVAPFFPSSCPAHLAVLSVPSRSPSLPADPSSPHSFGKEFTTAVEQKQIAQQDAERAKFVVEKAEQERQAAVIRAEGEAEAANTISAALNKAGDAFVQFRKIEASREIASSLSQSRNVTYVPAGSGNLLLQVPPQQPS
ncbi:Prohibitin-1 [Saitozyma sp. JCM 24511]|nr:Prohibitin-1 [Saitozyma sp. JCM 24511]